MRSLPFSLKLSDQNQKRNLMGENRKRKLQSTHPSPQSEPYPDHRGPTPEECRCVRDDLLALHGFPQEFLKYRRNASLDSDPDEVKVKGGEEGAGSKPTLECENETVLDGLISTLLSQNTTDSNSRRAFALLKSSFPTWEDVLVAEPRCVEDAIRCGGLASRKASCIRNILRSLLEKKGKMSLEYLRGMPVDEVKAELSHFKGIGPKTVACVLMFHLQQDDFPVDTHILHIAKSIGWVPSSADAEKAYLHLNKRIPNELKFDLNCLLFTHGKLCKKCAKQGIKHQRNAQLVPHCPLSNYSHSTKGNLDGVNSP